MALPGNHNIWKQKESSPGGIEPPTFRLTAERADRLRHGDCAKSGVEIRRKATLLKCGKFKSWLEDFFSFLLPLCISNSTLQVCYRHDNTITQYNLCNCISSGRASALHAEGTGIETRILHCIMFCFLPIVWRTNLWWSALSQGLVWAKLTGFWSNVRRMTIACCGCFIMIGNIQQSLIYFDENIYQ